MWQLAWYKNVTDDDQTPSTIGINIKRTNFKLEHSEIAKIMYPLSEKGYVVGYKAKGRISKRVFEEKKAR